MATLTARQPSRAKGRERCRDSRRLIDIFSLALTHGLIVLALWRLLPRDELDVEDAGPAPRRPGVKPRPEAAAEDASGA